MLAVIPAIFLSILFFLDQNITVRTVNSPDNKLRKGQAYHLDLLTLALCNAGASLFGLPWMCSATVESLNHVRAMTIYSKRKGKDGSIIEEPSPAITMHPPPPEAFPYYQHGTPFPPSLPLLEP